jgi:OOP family OmpA-OmpF porin
MKATKILILAGACIATLNFTTTAFAAVPMPMGWYVEGNVGASRANDASYGINGLSVSNNGIGANVNVGYKFMPYFGAEVGYTTYADSKVKYNGTQIARDRHYSYDIAAKGILPINDSGFDLFGKLGIARVESKVSATNATYAAANGFVVNNNKRTSTSLYLGLGGEYSFTPNLAANVQWARAKGNSNTGTLDLYSLGLNFLFS